MLISGIKFSYAYEMINGSFSSDPNQGFEQIGASINALEQRLRGRQDCLSTFLVVKKMLEARRKNFALHLQEKSLQRKISDYIKKHNFTKSATDFERATKTDSGYRKLRKEREDLQKIMSDNTSGEPSDDELVAMRDGLNEMADKIFDSLD